MNPRHLEYFAAIVQRGSIKSAAENLGVTQPAISAAVKKLETDLGVSLLTRNVKGSAPTLYGRALYDSSLAMAGVIETAKRKIATLQDPARGHLRVGTGPSMPLGPITTMIGDLMGEYPGIRIDHIAGNSAEDFEQRLLAEDIDIAFCNVRPDSLSNAIHATKVSDNPIGMLMASRHVSKSARSVSRSAVLSDFNWLVLRDDERQPPPGMRVSKAAERIAPPLSVTVDDLNIIKRLTLTTNSVGFFPMEEAAADLQSGALIELTVKNVPGAVRPIYALTRASAVQPPVLHLVLEKLKAAQTRTARHGKHRRLIVKE